MPGLIGDVPAKLWWPALVISLLDAARPLAELMAATREDIDQRTGRLAVGCYVIELHQLTLQALAKILAFNQSDRLFHWPLDAGGPPYHRLYAHFRTVLWRARLPD